MVEAYTISTEVEIEIADGEIVSQAVSSADIDNINQEMIDIVKFNFAWKTIQGKSKPGQIQDISIPAEQTLVGMYSNTENLLAEILKRKQYKHSRNIQYLAEQHRSKIIKIRFVLHPFSFVFLLRGDNHYHVVLETLDTEEATYLWSLTFSNQTLKSQLDLVNTDLNSMKDSGRSSFLTNAPSNFGRIIHDYSDEKKGFVVWKDQLRERLT